MMSVGAALVDQGGTAPGTTLVHGGGANNDAAISLVWRNGAGTLRHFHWSAPTQTGSIKGSPHLHVINRFSLMYIT